MTTKPPREIWVNVTENATMAAYIDARDARHWSDGGDSGTVTRYVLADDATKPKRKRKAGKR